MPASNSNLSRYWRRKRAALEKFISLPPKDPSEGQADLKTLTDWFHGMIEPAGGSLEDRVNAELGVLRQKKDAATGNPSATDRRSARLVSLVQSAVGSGPEATAYFLGVADAGYNPPELGELQEAVRTASDAAARFLEAAKRNIGPVWDALTALIANNADADPVLLDELTGLAEAMATIVPRGGGEVSPSGGFPSILIGGSSSSSS